MLPAHSDVVASLVAATVVVATMVVVAACGGDPAPSGSTSGANPASSEVASASAPVPPHVDPTEAPKGSVEKFAVLGGEPDFDGLATDGESLFVALKKDGEEVVLKVPAAGGSPTKIGALGGLANTSLRVSKGSLYWTDRGSYSVLPLSGGAPVRHPLESESLAIDAGEVFACGKERVVKANGDGKPTELASYPMSNGCALITDKFDVYWSYATGDLAHPAGVLMHVDKTGSKPGTRVAEGDGLGSFAIDEEFVYWTQSGKAELPADEAKQPVFETRAAVKIDGSIMRAPKKGGPPLAIATGELSPRSVLVDDKWIFWDSAIGLRRMAKSGGKPELLVSAANEQRYWRSSIVMTKSHLYWLTAGGDLLRAAK
jgi:hypothetical protein